MRRAQCEYLIFAPLVLSWWLRGWGWSHLKSQSLTCAVFDAALNWVRQLLEHLYRVFHIAVWLHQSAVVGFQISQENWAEAALPLITYTWTSLLAFLQWSEAYPDSRGECIFHLSKNHTVRRAGGMGYIDKATFGKYNLPQVSFHLRLIPLLSRSLSHSFVCNRCSLNVQEIKLLN